MQEQGVMDCVPVAGIRALWRATVHYALCPAALHTISMLALSSHGNQSKLIVETTKGSEDRGKHSLIVEAISASITTVGLWGFWLLGQSARQTQVSVVPICYVLGRRETQISVRASGLPVSLAASMLFYS